MSPHVQRGSWKETVYRIITQSPWGSGRGAVTLILCSCLDGGLCPLDYLLRTLILAPLPLSPDSRFFESDHCRKIGQSL